MGLYLSRLRSPVNPRPAPWDGRCVISPPGTHAPRPGHPPPTLSALRPLCAVHPPGLLAFRASSRNGYGFAGAGRRHAARWTPPGAAREDVPSCSLMTSSVRSVAVDSPSRRANGMISRIRPGRGRPARRRSPHRGRRTGTPRSLGGMRPPARLPICRTWTSPRTCAARHLARELQQRACDPPVVERSTGAHRAA